MKVLINDTPSISWEYLLRDSRSDARPDERYRQRCVRVSWTPGWTLPEPTLIDAIVAGRLASGTIKMQQNLVVVGWLTLQLFASALLHAADINNEHQFVRDGVLISLKDPSLAIDVKDSFTFVGRHPFTIRDVAAGERFIFADAEGDIIQRLFIVQFEGFLPGVDDFYRYDMNGSPVVANYPFRSNGYAFDIVDAIAANPKSESAATYPFLRSKGYSVPAHWMQWRSLTIADQARKKEIILFYVENVDSTGLTLADLYKEDEATDAWINIQQDLEVRANGSFRLTELNDDGEPITTTWSSIPNRFTR